MTERAEVQKAAQLLAAGELVAFPTETVYGLGADASNPAAVAKIFAAKGRPADHPVIVHLPHGDHVERWAIDVPQAAWDLAEAFWPGPLTLILKRAPGVPDAVTGGQDTVGLRVPGHPLALELLNAFDGGIAAPSANRFGRISPTTAQHVRDELGGRVAMVLDGGPCAVGIESTIVDLTRGEPVVLRPGHVTPENIAMVCGLPVRSPGQSADAVAPRVSGSLESHYAPLTPLELVAGDRLVARAAELAAAGHKLAVLAFTPPSSPPAGPWRIAGADPVSYAHDLYARLRELDAWGADRILVESVPGGPGWSAVADRLRRAAADATR